MTDPDLLDLLEILGDMNEAVASLGDGDSQVYIASRLADRKINSFRSAIRQRMNNQQGEV